MDFILASVESDYGGAIQDGLMEKAWQDLKNTSFSARTLSILMDQLDHGQLNMTLVQYLKESDEKLLKCIVARATVGLYNYRLQLSMSMYLGMDERSTDNSICSTCKDVSEYKCKRIDCDCSRSAATTACDTPCSHSWVSITYYILHTT